MRPPKLCACKLPAVARGLCTNCYHDWRATAIRRPDGTLPPIEDGTVAPIPHWEFENPDGEAWLIKRQEYLDTHDVPPLTPWHEVDEMMRQEEAKTMSETMQTPNTPALEKIAMEASRGQDINAAIAQMKIALADTLKIPLQQDSYISPQFDAERRAEVAAAAAPQPAYVPDRHAANPTHIRVIYPAGNRRFEICGMSEAELDAEELRIRSLYQ